MTMLADSAREPAPTDAQPPATGGAVAAKSNGLVGVVVVAAGFVAAFADAAPTGTGWWDLLLRFCLGAAFTASASVSSRSASLVAAGAAAMLLGSSWWLVVALAAFAIGLVGYVVKTSTAVTGALVGALAVQGLLRIGPFGFFGLPSLVAAAAMVPVLLGGYRWLSPADRRALRAAAVLIAIGLAALLSLAAYLVVSVRNSADAGIAAARSGLASARAGDTLALTAQLEQAQLHLDAANDRLGSAVLRPLALVPFVAQHRRALSTAASQGAIVAAEAVATARDTDIDQLQLRQGQFDLDLLAAMAPRLERTAGTLEVAAATISASRSGWLMPLVDDRLGALVVEIDQVLPEARLSATAARVLPAMLGADGERRYLMLFGSPGESREFGGFVGGFALLSVIDGDFELLESGGTTDLFERARAGELDDPAGYPHEYRKANPAFFPQNLTSTPNIGLIARAVRDVFPELDGAPIDGVIYADPFALAGLVELTGPVTIGGLDAPLDHAGVADFIFSDQYTEFDSRDSAFDAMGRLAQATAAALEGADLPGPERLGEVLGPAARAGRLQVVTFDDTENAFLTSVQLQRQFFAPTTVDAFAVIQTNATASKLDLFLHREIDYQVATDSAGNLWATLGVELRSDVPADAPPLTFGETDGTNVVLLSLYTRHDLAELLVNGEPHEYVVHEEFGFHRYAFFDISLAPGDTATVQASLIGRAPEAPYRLAIWHQPLVNNDIMRVAYTGNGASTVVATKELVENWVFSATG